MPSLRDEIEEILFTVGEERSVLRSVMSNDGCRRVITTALEALFEKRRLASVVSEESLEEIINKFWEEREAPSNDLYSKDLANAIATYINGEK